MFFDSPSDALPAITDPGMAALPSTAELAMQRDEVRAVLRKTTCAVQTTNLRLKMLGIEDALRRSDASAGEAD